MKTIFFLLAMMLSYFGALLAAHEDNHFNPKNYVYDDEGNPLFVKIYIESVLTEKKSSSPSALEQKLHFLSSMMQNDSIGNFLAVPIEKKKKKQDNDDEESTWTCPFCGTETPARKSACSNKDCILYRTPPRDWHCD